MATKRKYADVWSRLLAKQTVTVRCPVEMQARIVKAVFKLKDEDLENRKKWRLQHTNVGDLLTFTLRKKVNLYEL